VDQLSRHLHQQQPLTGSVRGFVLYSGKQVRAQLKVCADTALLQSSDKLLQSRRILPNT